MEWATIQRAKSQLLGEVGTVFKDWGGRIPIALVYPNTYHVGMSNLGFQAIYGFLNGYNEVVCERVFCGGDEPISLESQRPLPDFDVLAFSLSFEHDYFNVPSLLRLAGIPVFAADRDNRYPLMIAGGAAVTANPQPVSSFFDCFAIGEGEAILPQVVPIISENGDQPRHKLLKELAKVPGIYVPGVSDKTVVRQSMADLNEVMTASVVLTPHTELGDMYLLEISRGCSWGCRFCLAGHQFRPSRHRPIDVLLNSAKEGLSHGKRIGLVSAAISDHPRIDDLALGLRAMGADFSVSSLRINTLSSDLIKALAESGTKSISIAPEAGSERMRRVIRKGITEDDILRSIHMIAGHGFKQAKLYYMIGVPGETEDDVAEIVKLTLKIKGIFDNESFGTRLSVNVTPFVPKAGTPFQWLPMETASVLEGRISILKNGLGHKGVEIKSDSVKWSLVQGMLSRGESALGKAIAGMQKVSLAQWRRELERIGMDIESIHRELPEDAALPWDVIDSGTTKNYLRRELEKSRDNL